MKDYLVQDAIMPPPTSKLDRAPSRISPLMEVVDLLGRAVASKSEVTARGLYDSAYKLLDELQADMRSKDGALVRKFRPEIKKQMDALKRGRPTAHQLIKTASDFWKKVAAKT